MNDAAWFLEPRAARVLVEGMVANDEREISFFNSVHSSLSFTRFVLPQFVNNLAGHWVPILNA